VGDSNPKGQGKKAILELNSSLLPSASCLLPCPKGVKNDYCKFAKGGNNKMDKLNIYRQIVKQVVTQYSKLRPSHGNIRLDTIFDESQDRYALMQVGWDRGKRVRGNLIYIILSGEKVIVEYDGMESGITQDLIDQGIPEEDIVLAFVPQQNSRISA
jgi:hypothetical protein